MEIVAQEQAKLEQEKIHQSLIRKANDDLLQTTYDTRISEAKLLSPAQKEKLEKEIKTQGANLQVLHYQNTKNVLLAKGQKTLMELSSVTATNSALELDVTNRIGTITNSINNLTEQINSLQQLINQQSNESDQMKIAQVQQLGELQIQIAKLELEKQNMNMYINQIRSNQ
jgi:hypothetical protein